MASWKNRIKQRATQLARRPGDGAAGDAITWRQTGSTRWVGRSSDGYSLRVSTACGMWKWSIVPPGAGYVVCSGHAETMDAARVAATAGFEVLMAEIAARMDARHRNRNET